MNTEIGIILSKQRAYFESGATLPVGARIAVLKRLRSAILANESMFCDALHSDLRKSHTESYMTEIGMALDEIGFCCKHLSGWSKIRTVRTPLAQFSAKSFVVPEPYGLTLIMAPWNYPFLLSIAPLIGAIAAGNCAIVKPSAYAPATSRAIASLLGEIFPPEHVCVIEGGRAENEALLDQKFDYIFFTGSVAVGKLVMEKASRNLTPLSLELGGKSPAIIDRSAKLPLCAKRLAFGKYLNAGQTCVAPDYALLPAECKEEFLSLFQKCVDEFFPNKDYSALPVIVNEKHFDRITGLIDAQAGLIALGGGRDRATRLIEPTLLMGASWDSPIMQEEIFGPVLPVILYTDLEEELRRIAARPKPLALYLFTEDSRVEQRVLSRLSFGGGCVNDTIIHLATPHMGFGGVGESGMGRYHGKQSFNTFTHYKSIVKKHTWIDLPIRYQPYTEKNSRLIRTFLK